LTDTEQSHILSVISHVIIIDYHIVLN